MSIADRLEAFRRVVEETAGRVGFDAADRLASLKHLLNQVRERAEIEVAFALWDGSVVPAHAVADALTIVIADEGVIGALVRKPSLQTLANLWVTKRVDIRNGTVFDLARQRPRMRTRDIRKALDKKLALGTAAKFLPIARGGPWPLDEVPEGKPSGGDPGRNKQNISYHYDVSNAFYALWLDPEMVYSCAYFPTAETSLEEAQVAKLEMICRKLRLKQGERFLDIGCGWGGLVCHAARNYGVSAHGVTLSEEQLAFAREKIARLGLQDRVTVELKDYCALEGEYDKIASIGMFEHVGLDQHAAYFTKMRDLLRPRGLLLNHAITRPAKRTEGAFRKMRPEYAAIVNYVFPGSELDHIGNSAAGLERQGFEIHDVEGWREHYARTTRIWHDRLNANLPTAIQEVGEAKTRLWLLYLAGVSLAFERGTIGIFQTLASKRARGPSGLPPTRADLYR